MTPEKQNKNPELQSVISPLEERPSESRDTSMLASTLQATIDNLEEAAKKAKGEKAKELNKKLKDAQSWKNRLVKAGKSIIDAENKIREREKKGAHQLTDRGIEAQGKVIEKAQLEINNINKKLIILLKSFDETVGLKSDIEERKKLITLLSGGKNKGLPKDKQNLDFNILSIEELRALEAGINAKEGLAKTIEAGIDFLPFSERVIDVASTTVEQLNKVAAKIETNKKTFEKFKVIGVFSSLAEKSLFVYFYKYLENKAKPAIETLVKVFNDIKKKAEEYRLAQEKVLAETKKITEIEARIAKKQGQHFEMPSFETMSSLMKERNDSMLKSDFLEIFAKLLNNPVAEIKKYLASFDEAIEGQGSSLVRLAMNETAMVDQETLIDGYKELGELSSQYNIQCKVAVDMTIPSLEIENRRRELQSPGSEKLKFDDSKLKVLEGQLKNKQTALLLLNIGFLTKMIASLKFDESLLGKTYNKMVALASSPGEKRNLFTEFEAMKAGIKTRIDSFKEQITDISFALRIAKDEEKFRAELASGKDLSPESKAFAKEKAVFLGKKLKTLDENFNLAGGNSKMLASIDDERIALGFEKKVLEGKFSFEEALEIYWKMNVSNPKLAESVKFYLESLGLKKINETVFDPVDRGAVAFEENFASQFNQNSLWRISSGKATEEELEGRIVEGSEESLGGVERVGGARKAASGLLKEFESNGYYLSDLEKARVSIKEYMSSLSERGLASSSLYKTLQNADLAYGQLISRFSAEKEHIKKILRFVIDGAEADTVWNSIKRFGKIYVPIIIGATAFACGFAFGAGILLGAAAQTTVGLVATTVAAGAGATLGQEVMKEYMGIGMDLSAGNLLKSFAFNTTVSFVFIGGGRALGARLNAQAATRPLGFVGKTLMRLANGASGSGATAAGRATLGTVFAKQMSTMGTNVVRETGQEIIEEAGEQVHPLIGGLLSLINSMDGTNIDTSRISPDITKLFGDAGVTLTAANDTNASFEFDAGKVDGLRRGLSLLDGKMNVGTDGSVAFAFKATESATNEIVYEFRPSSESFVIRNFMASDAGVALQSDFKMGMTQDGGYAYDGELKSLKGRLEGSGFVVQTVGDFTVAQKGDLQLTFKPKRLVSGTNIGAMENTRLQTLEGVDPARLEEIRAGSTISSEVVSLLTTDIGTLWGKMKTSLGGDTRVRTPEALAKGDAKITAEVTEKLQSRGLPEDFFGGKLSPVEQLQVLNSVAAIEAEADSAANINTSDKVLLPERLIDILEGDSLGVYKLKVLLAKLSAFPPPFSVEQIAKIASADEDLASDVLLKQIERNPEPLGKPFADLVKALGSDAATKLKGFSERMADGDIAAFEEFGRILERTRGKVLETLPYASLSLLLGGCTAGDIALGTLSALTIDTYFIPVIAGFVAWKKGWLPFGTRHQIRQSFGRIRTLVSPETLRRMFRNALDPKTYFSSDRSVRGPTFNESYQKARTELDGKLFTNPDEFRTAARKVEDTLPATVREKYRKATEDAALSTTVADKQRALTTYRDKVNDEVKSLKANRDTLRREAKKIETDLTAIEASLKSAVGGKNNAYAETLKTRWTEIKVKFDEANKKLEASDKKLKTAQKKLKGIDDGIAGLRDGIERSEDMRALELLADWVPGSKDHGIPPFVRGLNKWEADPADKTGLIYRAVSPNEDIKVKLPAGKETTKTVDASGKEVAHEVADKEMVEVYLKDINLDDAERIKTELGHVVNFFSRNSNKDLKSIAQSSKEIVTQLDGLQKLLDPNEILKRAGGPPYNAADVEAARKAVASEAIQKLIDLRKTTRETLKKVTEVIKKSDEKKMAIADKIAIAKLILGLIGLGLLAAGGYTAYQYLKDKDDKNPEKSPVEAAQEGNSKKAAVSGVESVSRNVDDRLGTSSDFNIDSEEINPVLFEDDIAARAEATIMEVENLDTMADGSAPLVEDLSNILEGDLSNVSTDGGISFKSLDKEIREAEVSEAKAPKDETLKAKTLKAKETFKAETVKKVNKLREINNI